MKFDRYCQGSYINGPCNNRHCNDFNPCDCNNNFDNCNHFPNHQQFPNFPCSQFPNFPCSQFPSFTQFPNFPENKNCCLDPMWLVIAGIIICNNKRRF